MPYSTFCPLFDETGHLFGVVESAGQTSVILANLVSLLVGERSVQDG